MGTKAIHFPAVWLLLAGLAWAGNPLKAYPTRYYTIYADATPEMVREAGVRLTKMAGEYQRRTRDFSSGVAGKLPFYLFGDERSYADAGGRPGTAGMYTGQKLMALAGPEWTSATWHVVQHEGFHQYAHERIGPLPMWVEEGLADYFGEAIFTGDGFVFGIIPPWRLERVQQMIRGNRFRPMEDVMRYTPDEWNRDINLDNYDQAWSMVQFLAQGKEGKLQKPFEEYVKQVSHGRQSAQAWHEKFGPTADFQEAWRQYWLKQESTASADLYTKAAAQTYAGFLARAQERGQRFATFADFEKAAGSGQLRCREDLWLPPTLLTDTLEAQLESSTHWMLHVEENGAMQVIAVMPDHRRITVNVTLAEQLD